MDSKVIQDRNDRIKYILDNYHPLLHEDNKMNTEEASRLIEYLIEMGKTEDEAFNVLKYCTVEADFIEE